MKNKLTTTSPKKITLRQILLALSCFLFAGCVFSQSNPSDWQKRNLQGQVKLIREKSHSVAYDTQGNLTRIEKRYAIEYEFSQQGMIINWADMYQDGMVSWFYNVSFDSLKNQKIVTSKMNENFVINRVIYVYDEFQREAYWYMENSIEDVIYRLQHHYDKKGRCIKSESIRGFPDSVYVERYSAYQYDRKGNRLSELRFSGNGELLQKIIYAYDKFGNLTSETTYDERGVQIKKLAQFYNEENLLSQLLSYNKDGSVQFRKVFNYGTSSHLSGYFIYDHKDSLTEYMVYRFEFDDRKNWIKRTEFINDVPTEEIEREIFYFD